MKPLPSDPFAFQARVMSAFCDDLFDIASGKSASCERTNALRQVSISTRDGVRANNAAPVNK
jgi:hypothetical protein